MAREIPDEFLVQAAQDEEHLAILRQIGVRSYLVVPLRSRDEILGTLTLVTAESGRRYEEADLRLAEGMGHTAGIAVANARLYAEAQAAVRGRQEILSVVSHDLRNLLQTMILRVGQLGRSASLDERARRDVTTLGRTCDRMARLIGDLMDLSRIETGKLAIVAAPASIRSLVEQVAEAHEPLAAERGQRLSVRIDDDAEPSCDRERVQQVLANLLSNALRHTPDGGEIGIAVRVAADEVRLEVTDRGPGIPPELVPRIFERFVQGDGDRPQGLGLGLYIARAIAEAHGGRIGVESAPGAGATFWFTLPRAP